MVNITLDTSAFKIEEETTIALATNLEIQSENDKLLSISEPIFFDMAQTLILREIIHTNQWLRSLLPIDFAELPFGHLAILFPSLTNNYDGIMNLDTLSDPIPYAVIFDPTTQKVFAISELTSRTFYRGSLKEICEQAWKVANSSLGVLAITMSLNNISNDELTWNNTMSIMLQGQPCEATIKYITESDSIKDLQLKTLNWQSNELNKEKKFEAICISQALLNYVNDVNQAILVDGTVGIETRNSYSHFSSNNRWENNLNETHRNLLIKVTNKRYGA